MKNILFFWAIPGLLGLTAANAAAEQPQRLSYEEFIKEVQEGKVESVVLGPFYYLEGRYKDSGQESDFFAQRPLEPSTDPLLTELLEKQEVGITMKEPPKPGVGDWLMQLVAGQLVPLVLAGLVVFVLIYVVRINNKIDQVIIR